MSTATAITYKTECLLCHGVQENPPLNIRPEDKHQPKAVTDFMNKLRGHITKKHTAELKKAPGMIDQYVAFLLLSQFESEDPSVQAVLNGMRADIFQRCRKNIPSDADLEIVASRCEFSTDRDYREALVAMKALRDLCCETGPHAPKLP